MTIRKIAAGVVLFFLVCFPCFSGVFTDNFDSPRDYLVSGTGGSGWDGIIGQSTANILDASISSPGVLTIQCTGPAWWDGCNTPSAPLLYIDNVAGDFVAEVRVTDFSGTSGAPVYHNDCGIMAIVGDPALAGPGEDWVSVRYFPTWVGNMGANTDDCVRVEFGGNGKGWNPDPYLQLERSGNAIHTRTSVDGINWVELGSSPRIRTDMDGLPLRVGLWQAVYGTTNTALARFDDFYLQQSMGRLIIQETGSSTEVYESGFPASDSYTVTLSGKVPDSNVVVSLSCDEQIEIDKTQLVFTPSNWDQPQTVTVTAVDDSSYEPTQSSTIIHTTSSSDSEFDGFVVQLTVNIVDDDPAGCRAAEDFEIYSNSGDLINTWIPNKPNIASLETTTVYEGAKALRINYDNSNQPYICEVTRTFATLQDWTVDNIKALSIYIYGQSGNVSEQLYVTIEDDGWGTNSSTISCTGPACGLDTPSWQKWDIDLQQFVENNPGLNLSRIKKITIGIGNPENPQFGGFGTICIDALCLFPSRCLEETRPAGDLTGDCAVNGSDLMVMASQWLTPAADANIYPDDMVDFKDYCLLAMDWLSENIWPAPDKIEILQPVPFTNVTMTDVFWAPRIETNRSVTVPYAFGKCEETGRVDNFKLAGGLITGVHQGGFPFDDTDPYKVLEGASYGLSVQWDPNMDAYLDELIYYFDAAMEDDGYLYTCRTNGALQDWTGPTRWSNLFMSHELYNMGHFYEATVAHYYATGKENMLNLAKKNAALLLSVFNNQGLRIPPGHQVIEMGLAKLYRATGDVNYLNLAKFYLDVRGYPLDGRGLWGEYSQDHKPVLQQDEAVGHAVRATYMYSGMADVAALTGDYSYVTAIDKIWTNVVSKKFYITGGMGSGETSEGFGPNYSLPNNGYCETCAQIGNAMWNHRMFLLHGHAKYIDVMERTMYNSLIDGVSLDGTYFFYPNPLTSSGEHARSPWFGCACCPGNVTRFVASMPGYMYVTKNDSIYVNLYGDSTGNINLNNNSVVLVQDTNYPWDGDITITVEPNVPSVFDILLRIPGWARNQPVPSNLYQYMDHCSVQPTVFLNGQPVDYQLEKGYVRISKQWQAGDTIEINLPMPVRKVLAHPSVAADIGRVAIERGPIVYCVEWPDIEGGYIRHLVVPDDANLSTEYRMNLLNTSNPLHITEGAAIKGIVKGAYYNSYTGQTDLIDEELTAIPYCLWSHRGSGQMDVWMPRDPNLALALVPPTPGEMEGYWRLDETTGTQASDSSGMDMDGTCVGLSFDNNSVTGVFGKALQFDGVDDYIDLPNGFGDFVSGISISVWAYPTAAANYCRFIDFGNGPGGETFWLGRIGTSSDLCFEVWVTGAAGGRVTAAGAIELNKWQMFTVTCDENGSSKIYKNGQLITSGTTFCPSAVTRTNNYIGKSNWNDALYKGYMDDVRIYSYILTSDDVSALYYGGKAENPIPANDANSISVSTSLSWIPGSSAPLYDVYLGTSYESVANAGPTNSEHKSRQAATTYQPPAALMTNTDYFWRIDHVNPNIKGRVWHFTTAP